MLAKLSAVPMSSSSSFSSLIGGANTIEVNQQILGPLTGLERTALIISLVLDVPANGPIV